MLRSDPSMAYSDSSTVEPKRSHQWFMDGVEPEVLPNKKQAIGSTINHSFTALLNSNVSPWMYTSSLPSVPGQYTERLLDVDIGRSINYDDRNGMPVGFCSTDTARKLAEDSFGSDSSFGLSIAESLEDPRLSLNYGGIRKVKASQVKDNDKLLPAVMVDNYTMGINSVLPAVHAFSETDGSTVSVGHSFNRVDNNMMSLGDTFNGEENNYITMGQPLNKINGDELTGSEGLKERDCYLSINNSFNQDDASIATLDQNINRVDGNVSVGNSIQDHNVATFMAQSSRNDDSHNTSMGQSFNRTSESIASMTCYGRVNESTISLMQTYNRADKNNLSLGQSFGRGEGNIISFGGVDDDDDFRASERLLSRYELLMVQSLGKRSENLSEKGSVQSNDTLTTSSVTTLSGGAISRKDEQKANKKPAPNSFPSNVRTLLSTGIFDGVPVKYIAWSREKELCGIIKGTGYICGCLSCNYSKTINAYEFENHAGTKTKHPNNHIYFENGKTVYGIVQELRNTRQDLLFEVIQTVSGSPINQKRFRIWKESFLAATRELQRIYSKDEGKLPS